MTTGLGVPAGSVKWKTPAPFLLSNYFFITKMVNIFITKMINVNCTFRE